jgi:hypothetical protein
VAATRFSLNGRRGLFTGGPGAGCTGARAVAAAAAQPVRLGNTPNRPAQKYCQGFLICPKQARSKPVFARMSEQVLLDESYATVLADPATPCIIVQLHAFANREQFKHMMNLGLAYFQAHTSHQQPWGWIADTRHMSAIHNEVQQWLAQDWNVRAYNAGLREMSIVASQNIIGQLATQQYAQLAAAQPEKYVLEPVYYPSLERAKQGVRQRVLTSSAKH